MTYNFLTYDDSCGNYLTYDDSHGTNVIITMKCVSAFQCNIKLYYEALFRWNLMKYKNIFQRNIKLNLNSVVL